MAHVSRNHILGSETGKNLFFLRIKCHFFYQLVKEITRENIQNIVPKFTSKKCSYSGTKNADAPEAFSRHYGALVAAALV